MRVIGGSFDGRILKKGILQRSVPQTSLSKTKHLSGFSEAFGFWGKQQIQEQHKSGYLQLRIRKTRATARTCFTSSRKVEIRFIFQVNETSRWGIGHQATITREPGFFRRLERDQCVMPIMSVKA